MPVLSVSVVMSGVGHSRPKRSSPHVPALPEYFKKLTQIQRLGLCRKVPICMARPRVAIPAW